MTDRHTDLDTSAHPVQPPPQAVTPPTQIDPVEASDGSTTPRGGSPAVPPPVHRDRRRRAVGWQSKDILRAVALGFGLFILLKLLWFANQLFLTVFLGILFGLAVSAGVDRLERFRIPRGVAAAAIVIGFYGALTAFGMLMAPTIREQGIELRRRMPIAVHRLEAWIDKRPGLLSLILNRPGATPQDSAAVGRLPAGLKQGAPPPTTVAPRPDSGRAPAPEGAPSTVQTLSDRLGQQLAGAGRYLFPFLSSTLAVCAGLLLITFLSIYIAADPKLYHAGLMHMFPRRVRPRAGEVLSGMATVLRKWLVTQLIAMAVIGVVTTIVLLVLRVKAAFALGLLAGLLEFIPTIGPILSAVPAIAMGFVDSPEKALTVAIAYMGIQFLENHILIPMLMKGGVDIPPVLTILGQALMAIVFGFLGLMVAVPMLAASMVAVKMLYVEGVVGDQVKVFDAGPDDDDD